MTIEPLTREIYDYAKANGILKIFLEFSGGSDEGFTSVSSSPPDSILEGMVYDWATNVYPYSGAGDGSDYGDDIEYDIEKGKVSQSDWHMVRKDTEYEEEDMPMPPAAPKTKEVAS